MTNDNDSGLNTPESESQESRTRRNRWEYIIRRLLDDWYHAFNNVPKHSTIPLFNLSFDVNIAK